MDYDRIKYDMLNLSNNVLDLITEARTSVMTAKVTNLAFQHLSCSFKTDSALLTGDTNSAEFVLYLLRSQGIILVTEDLNSDQLLHRFPSVPEPRQGSIVYYGRDIATHCMYCINSYMCIGIVGLVDNVCINKLDNKFSGTVCMTPIAYRADIKGYNNPFNFIKE